MVVIVDSYIYLAEILEKDRRTSARSTTRSTKQVGASENTDFRGSRGAIVAAGSVRAIRLTGEAAGIIVNS